MKSLLLSLLLGFTLSLAYPGVASPPRRNLHFRFDLHDPTYIHVTLELTTSPTGADLLLLPSQWAGETELYRAVSNLHITTPDATLSATGSPARCVLHSRHPKRVTVDYDLSQDWSGPLKHPFEHRAILGPTLFEFNGENGLVTPSISGTEPVDVTFDFADLPPTQTLITSFGTSVHQHVVGPWSDVRNALFTGGILKTEDLTVDGRRVLLAMYGTWAFTPAQIAPAIQHILKTERRLWHDTAIPFYAIVISPYDSTASGGGGSGFTNIFNLFLADRQTFSIDTASLIAHEAFHHWNPRALGIVEDTAQIAWFGEGFTRFYQDTVLERAGIVTKAEYLARLNATIRDYLISPNRNVPNAELAHTSTSAHTPGNSAAWNPPLAGPFPAPSPTAGPATTPSYGPASSTPLANLPITGPSLDLTANQQPYLRGAMIALWLSHAIDRQTNGVHTLTDLLLALEAERSEPLTADRIFRTAGRFVSPATVDQLRAFAIEGLTVPVPPDSLGECVAFHNHPTWTFDLGFDPASLHQAGIIQGIKLGSSAWQAGVRDGQQLGGFALWSGNPDREVTLTLRDIDGRREKLTFLPHGKLLSIPQAEQIPQCPQEPRIP